MIKSQIPTRAITLWYADCIIITFKLMVHLHAILCSPNSPATWDGPLYLRSEWNLMLLYWSYCIVSITKITDWNTVSKEIISDVTGIWKYTSKRYYLLFFCEHRIQTSIYPGVYITRDVIYAIDVRGHRLMEWWYICMCYITVQLSAICTAALSQTDGLSGTAGGIKPDHNGWIMIERPQGRFMSLLSIEVKFHIICVTTCIFRIYIYKLLLLYIYVCNDIKILHRRQWCSTTFMIIRTTNANQNKMQNKIQAHYVRNVYDNLNPWDPNNNNNNIHLYSA